MDPVSAGLAIGGTLLQMKASSDDRKEKRKVLNQQLERDDAAAKKSNELVQAEGEMFAPDARREALASTEGQAFDRSVADLRTGAGGGDLGAIQTAGDAGNVSEDFVTRRAERAATEGTRLMDVAREQAKTRAPSLTLVSEGQRRGNLASALQNLYGSNRNMAQATQNDADNTSPSGLGALGAIASSIGTSMAAGRIAKQGATLPAPSGGINFGSRA